MHIIPTAYSGKYECSLHLIHRDTCVPSLILLTCWLSTDRAALSRWYSVVITGRCSTSFHYTKQLFTVTLTDREGKSSDEYAVCFAKQISHNCGLTRWCMDQVCKSLHHQSLFHRCACRETCLCTVWDWHRTLHPRLYPEGMHSHFGTQVCRLDVGSHTCQHKERIQ